MQTRTQTPHPEQSPLPVSPYVLLVITMVFWGANWVVGRAIKDDLTPIEISFWRWTITLALLLPFTARQIWRHRAALAAKWQWLLVISALGFALFNQLIYMGVQYTTATNGALIISSMPVAIVAMAWLVLRDTMTKTQLLGLAISLVGVLILIARGDPQRLMEVRFNIGDLWVLLCVPVFGLYSVMLRFKPDGIGPISLITAMTAVGVLMLMPFYLMAPGLGLAAFTNPKTLAALGFVSLFPSVGGYLFWNLSVARVGPGQSGYFLHLVPIFGALLAWLFLDERLFAYHLGGAVFIVMGILLCTRKGRDSLGAAPS